MPKKQLKEENIAQYTVINEKVVLLRKLSSCDCKVGPIINLSKTHRTLYSNSPPGAQNINYQYDVNSTQKKKNTQKRKEAMRENNNKKKKQQRRTRKNNTKKRKKENKKKNKTQTGLKHTQLSKKNKQINITLQK